MNKYKQIAILTMAIGVGSLFATTTPAYACTAGIITQIAQSNSKTSNCTAGIIKELQHFSSNDSITVENIEKEVIEVGEPSTEELSSEEKEEAYVRSQPSNVPNEDPYCRSWAMCYEFEDSTTCVTSDQYALLHSGKVETDENGYLLVDGRYLVAVGTTYASNIGDKIDVLYEDGTIMKYMVTDFKADIHTDESNRYTRGWYEKDGSWTDGDGSVIEFMLDRNTFNDYRLPVYQTPNNIIAVVNVTNMEF